MGFPYCPRKKKKTKDEVLHEDTHLLPAFHAYKIMSVSQNRLKNNLKTGYDSFIADKSTGRKQHSQLVICCGNMQWCHLDFAMHLWPLHDWQTYFWEHTITTFDNFIAHVATLDVEDVMLAAVLKLNLKKYTYTFVWIEDQKSSQESWCDSWWCINSWCSIPVRITKENFSLSKFQLLTLYSS